MQTPNFLEIKDILEIHNFLIERLGGALGIRDQGLLESALAQPQASFLRELLHPTIPAQAAAYLYHLSQNHPFLDGNKRTAYGAMETFLPLNGCNLSFSNQEAYDLVMQVAQGQMTKEEVTAVLEQHIKKL